MNTPIKKSLCADALLPLFIANSYKSQIQEISQQIYQLTKGAKKKNRQLSSEYSRKRFSLCFNLIAAIYNLELAQ
jgi:hypothetical protein